MPRTIQDYIDARPVWPDGTPAPGAPLTPMQVYIVLLASAGKFFEGLVVFLTGVALPLLVHEFGLTATEKGLLSAAPLCGILVGASALGGLADRYGRRPLFIIEMALFTAAIGCVMASPTFGLLVASLFVMGAALGCDYPTAHMVISESTPSRLRGRLVLGAFGFQALGALVGTGIGYVVLANYPEVGAWRYMYGCALVPALVVTLLRLRVPESGNWLASRGRTPEAEAATLRLLDRTPRWPSRLELSTKTPQTQGTSPAPQGVRALFTRSNRRSTVLASVPWFLQDLSTYGIGIFTPTILASVLGAHTAHGAHGAHGAHNIAAIVADDMFAARGAALLDVLLIVGIVIAVALADRVGRMRLQFVGFIGCAVGLALAAASQHVGGTLQMVLLFAGFMLFNTMTNMGPNAMTYLVAGEVFPTRLRGTGAGFAASFAKVGAVTTAFCFPILLHEVGTTVLLVGLVGTSLAGALVTWCYWRETAGVNLEEVGHE